MVLYVVLLVLAHIYTYIREKVLLCGHIKSKLSAAA